MKKLKIAHICLSSSFTEGMLYQENVISEINKTDGHDVLVVSDCRCYVNGKNQQTNKVDKIMTNGVRLVRLPLSGKFLPNFIKNKIRFSYGLKSTLDNFKPDVILHHSIVGLALLTVHKYKLKNPHVKLYLDSHADINNSGKYFFSRILQYKFFYRAIYKYISKNVDKVFYISHDARDFLFDMYRIDDDMMEFLPLGGFIPDLSARIKNRSDVRTKYGINQDDIVFIHTGKFNNEKRTLDVINSFLSNSNERSKLFLVGVFEDDIAEFADALLQDNPKIFHTGWQSGSELIKFLCASDCYLQPGSQSATLQNAICCGLPVVIYPYSSHKVYLKSNGFFVSTYEELESIYKYFNNKNFVKSMSISSSEIASSILDYHHIAKRLYADI